MRLAIRSLIRRPALVVTIVGMLTIALAFVIASLGVLNGLLIQPYQYPKLGQLLLIRDSKPAEGAHQGHAIASADFIDVRQTVSAFSAVTGWQAVPAVITSGGADPERVQALAVTANFFATLGIRPILGRDFTADADTSGHDDVVLFSRRFWTSRLGGDASSVGRVVGFNGRPTTVIGIVRDEDCYPPGVDAWVPLVFSASDASERALQRIAAIGRLRDGATDLEARAQLTALSNVLSARYPATNHGRGFDLLALRREQYEFTASLFLFVQAAALLVFLMAVINVNNLLVARTLNRRQELAIRAMLGARATRVVAVVLCEVAVLTTAAGAAGALFAPGVMELIRASLPGGIARWIAGWSSLRVDALSFGAGALIALGAAIGLSVTVGLAAIRAVGAIHESARVTRRTVWGRRVLIGAQVGLTAALLLAGTVMTAGFSRLSAAFASLSPTQLLRFTLTLPEARYPDAIRLGAFHQALLAAINELPEVETAALIRNEPASNVPNPVVPFQQEEGPIQQPSEQPRIDVEVVSATAFAALRLSVLAGRGLADSDSIDSPHVAVVSNTAARRFWSDRSPVGASVRLGNERQPIRIVGVVSDFTLNWYDPEMRPILYLPDAQAPARTTAVIVRTRTDPLAIARRVRAAVAHLDDRQPVSELEPLSASIADSLSPVRVIQRLLLFAAALAAFLAGAGIYGVLAQWVVNRARELGVRLALGATRGSIARLVLREALMTSGFGAAAGTLLAVAAVRAAAGVLFGVPSIDVNAVVSVAAGVLGLTIVASVGPARRAARVDVAQLLRFE